MIAAKTMLSGVAVVSLCFSVRRKDLMGGIAGAMGADMALVVTLAISCLAEFHSRSHRVLRVLKVAPGLRGKSMKRSVRALQPIAFQIGRLYDIDKSMVLTLLEIIITAIVNLLLLLSK